MLKKGNYWLKRVIKDPFSHFLIAGTLLFICYSLYHSSSSVNTISVTPSQVTQQKKDDTLYFGSPPSKQELNKDINHVVLKQMLSQQALKLGLEKGDPNLNEMLMQRYLSYVSQLAKINATNTSLLHQYYLTHQQRYKHPDMYSLCYHFLTPQEVQHPIPTMDSQQCLSDVSKQALLAKLGTKTIDALAALAPNQWSTPIDTPFGAIAIKVLDYQKAGVLSFKQAKQQLAHDFARDDVKNKIAAVIKQYHIALPVGSDFTVNTKTLLNNV
ncbi:peptidylprolyl isomerase [Photobacterium leiognathi]|uniref:peptidylprolyl isomerase n=1 Tax=Photobacterium leiognathi TaxID=553611 RepID=UPI0029815EF2|nr:peptidylprolyl isomerase [Photobacterium leiognathi]